MPVNDLQSLDKKLETFRGEIGERFDRVHDDLKELTKALRDLIRLDGDIRRLQDAIGGSSSGRRVLGAQEVPESGEIANCVRSPPERLHRARTLRMRAGGCCSLAVPHVLSHACTSSSAMYSPVAS